MDKILDIYLSLCIEVYDLSKPNPPEDAYDFYQSSLPSDQDESIVYECRK
ncbi:MAG: hypothetical protein AB7F64_03455 [Gammaproteobacteria bacterium]